MNFDEVDLKFVFTIMQDIGITLPRLHEVYDRLLKNKVSVGELVVYRLYKISCPLIIM